MLVCNLSLNVAMLFTNLLIVASEWYDGLVTEYLVETFSDYFTDIQMYEQSIVFYFVKKGMEQGYEKCDCSFPLRFLEERSYRRCVELCLEETIVVYVDHLLTQVWGSFVDWILVVELFVDGSPKYMDRI